MKKYLEPPKISGLDFTAEEIRKCVKGGKILRISLALSHQCNFKCPYCYVDRGKNSGELGLKKIFSIINDAKKNGAKTITLVGGEPFAYPKIKPIVSHISSQGLKTLIFTNGSLMTKELADFLFNRGVSMIVKLNSFDQPKIQEKMVGDIKGAHEKIKKTLSILAETGFDKTSPTRLGVETVVSKTNLSQIPKIFRFARKNNIYPYVELITPAGAGSKYKEILSKKESEKIFKKLLLIDRKEFGYNWVPRPPQAASTCRYLSTSIYINPNGAVQPCPTIGLKIGDLKKESLSDILNKKIVKKIKNIGNFIEGKCGACRYNKECYGCRGAAYNITGNLCHEDVICWI